MIWKTSRTLLAAAIAASSVVLAAGALRAATVTSTVLLGPPNGAGNLGNVTASLSLGSGSTLALGSNAISGNYKQHIVFVNTNIGFSAQNQTSTLSLSPSTVSLSTSNASGTASLTYDNVTPGTPQILNSLNANLSDGTVTPFGINASGISMGTSVGTFTLTPTFSGSISGVTFTSSGPATVSGGNPGNALVPGTFSILLNGSVTGSLNVLGINLNVGTLFTLPTNTQVTFSGSLPIADLQTSDTGVPFGAFPDSTHLNNMLVDLQSNLSALPPIPFQFVAPLATSESFSVGSSSSGVTSINIQNTTLTANLMLSNLAFNLSGQVPSALIPEPSSVALGSLALVGFIGMVYRRKKAA
ncbi:MAG TPA: hypothetical protein VHD36_07030 [Pirellulales bacterium]|nr:hypothetical protein [Pirellulales bacterium]